MVSENISQKPFEANVTSIANETLPATPLQQAWLGLSIIVTVFGFCATSLVLATYALDRGFAKNLFHIYVKNLLIADWFFFALLSPLVILIGMDSSQSYPSWLCSLFDYSYFVIASLPGVAHVCISSNRFWAMTFPQSYREQHSGKAAIGHCVAGVVFIHLIGLPVVAFEKLRYGEVRLPGCSPDFRDSAVGALAFLNVVVIYVFIALIVGLYPYLWWKHKMRQQMKTAFFTKPVSGASHPIPTDEKASSRAHRTGEPTGETITASHASHAFTALSWLTSTVFFFWTPFLIYGGICSFDDSLYDADLLAWLNLLFSMQTMCDPLIFLFSLKDLRGSFVRRLVRLKGNGRVV